jgi:hypothetical protein
LSACDWQANIQCVARLIFGRSANLWSATRRIRIRSHRGPLTIRSRNVVFTQLVLFSCCILVPVIIGAILVLFLAAISIILILAVPIVIRARKSNQPAIARKHSDIRRFAARQRGVPPTLSIAVHDATERRCTRSCFAANADHASASASRVSIVACAVAINAAAATATNSKLAAAFTIIGALIPTNSHACSSILVAGAICFYLAKLDAAIASIAETRSFECALQLQQERPATVSCACCGGRCSAYCRRLLALFHVTRRRRGSWTFVLVHCHTGDCHLATVIFVSSIVAICAIVMARSRIRRFKISAC